MSFKVLEGFGGRCGEVTLDGQETSSAEMDKVFCIQKYPYIWCERMFQGCRPGDNLESLRQFFVLPGWRLDGFGRGTRGQAADLPLWKPAWWRAAHTMISQLTAHCDNAIEQVVPTHSSLYTIRAHTMRLKPPQSELLPL